MANSVVMRNSHRMFLQSFMSKGLLDGKDVKLLYKNVCERFEEPVPDTEEGKRKKLAEFVITINSAIKPFHMEIKKGVSEEDGSNCYCLVNISENHITKLSSDFTPNELELFKKMVESMVESDTGTIGSVFTLNLTEQLGKKMSKEAAQDMLRRMERDKWICVADGQISLATRAILELEQYIKEQYPHMATFCNLCKKLALQGYTCDRCDTKLHHACAVRFFSRQETRQECPGNNCTASWAHLFPDTELSEPSQSQPATSQGRKRKARH